MSAPDGGCALVTGGTRGIGAAVADALRERGWNVATLSRNGGDLQADVSDAEAVERAFVEARDRFGPVHVLVNNAGQRRDGLAIRMSAEDWGSVVGHQPVGRLPLHPAGARRHAVGPLGPHRQRLVDRRRARQPRPGQLRREQGGPAGADAHGGAARWRAKASPATPCCPA